MLRHPTQLYEALLEGVLLFAILFALSRKNPPRPQGTFLGVFLIVYGLARFAVEFVRQPDAQLGYLWGGWLTMGQVLSAPLVIAGIAVLAFSVARKLPQTGLPDNGLPAETVDVADTADAVTTPESMKTEGKED